MVDDSPAPRPHGALPMAPRLRRSMRLRHALSLRQPVTPAAATRGTRPSRRRMKGNFFAFMAAQVLIAVVAFIAVTDYVADGPIKQAVLEGLGQVAGERLAAPPPRDDAASQETTGIQESPAASEPVEAPTTEIEKQVATVEPVPPAIEPPAALQGDPAPVETPPAAIEEPAATVEPAPQADEPPAVMQDVPTAPEPANAPPAVIEKPAATVEPLPQAEEPAAAMQDVPAPAETPPAAIEKPAATAEPAPQAEAAAEPLPVQPPPAEKAGEEVVALAPIPNLAPQADVPAAPPPSESVKPEQGDGQVIRDCATCPELALVNGGRFAMGSESDALEQQASITATQEVTIAAAFAIGRTEITFDEWSQCVEEGGCTSLPADENWGRGRRPVINVSFNDITQQYLPWLSGKTGFTYRLPTEAEWEFAARGGAAAPAGQAYSFGDDATLLCQYGNSSDTAGTATCSDGFAATAPAGSLKPNPLGLFDMHGNVWEWLADCWQPQYSAKAAKPSETCTTRVLRGGSWASNAAALRSAARGWESQDKSKNSIGFRVARALP